MCVCVCVCVYIYIYIYIFFLCIFLTTKNIWNENFSFKKEENILFSVADFLCSIH